MSNERVNQELLIQRLNKVEIGLAKMDRVVRFEGTPILDRPLERLGQLSGVDRISAAAELAQKRMALQSTLSQIYEVKVKPVLTLQREELQLQLAAEQERIDAQKVEATQYTMFDRTEAAVLASLILDRHGVIIKQNNQELFIFHLSRNQRKICNGMIHSKDFSGISQEELVEVRTEVTKKLSKIQAGGKFQFTGDQIGFVYDVLNKVNQPAVLDGLFKGHFIQFLTESPTLIGRSYRSVVEPETVERVWILPKRNGNGHAKAESVIAESVQPKEAGVEAEKQLPTLKVNLETHEIQLEGWEKPRYFMNSATWSIISYLAQNPNKDIPYYVLRELAEKSGAKKDFINGSIYELRKVIESDPKNPKIIIQSGLRRKSVYYLYADVEIIGSENQQIETPHRVTRTVTLPDGQVVSAFGYRGQTLELFTTNSSEPYIPSDEVALAIYGSTDHQARKKASAEIRGLNQICLEKRGWHIINLISRKASQGGQKAQYSLVKINAEETQPPEWEWEGDTIRQVEPAEPAANSSAPVDGQDQLKPEEETVSKQDLSRVQDLLRFLSKDEIALLNDEKS